MQHSDENSNKGTLPQELATLVEQYLALQEKGLSLEDIRFVLGEMGGLLPTKSDSELPHE